MNPQRGTGDGAQIGQAVDAFRRILRALRVSARRGELSTGLSPAQHFVLSIVAAHPGASVNDIAEATLTDRSSAAAVVAKLVERGFATRDQSPTDGRRAAISITAMGRRAMRSAAPPPTTILIEALRDLTAHERWQLVHGLAALTRSMGIESEPAGMLFEDGPQRATRTPRRLRG